MNHLYKQLNLTNTLKAIGIATILLIFLTAQAFAQVATYNFENPPGQDGSQNTNAVASNDANVTAGVMSKTGISNSTTAYDGGFNGYTWPTAATINTGKYYEFTVTPSAGYTMNLTSLVFDEWQNDTGTGTGNYFWTVRSSLDSYAADIQAPTSVAQVNVSGDNNGSITTGNTVTLPGSFSALTSAVTFRFYAYDVSVNTMDWGIDNVVLNGTVADITSPSITATNLPTNQTYAIGENLDFVIDYDEAVVVAGGTPRIQITLTSGTVYANYLSGSGTNSLTFRYTVASNDEDADGISLTSPIDLNGATIQDGAGNNADLAISTAGTGSILVDGVAPSVSSLTLPANQTYAPGDNLNFIVNYNDNVTVAGGTPRIQITLSSGTVYANYASGSGTANLTFTYTVATNDLDADGITLTSPIDLNGATMQDANGNNTDLAISTTGTGSILIDGVAPTVSSLTLPANQTYLLGQNLNFIANFNEPVTVAGGTPRIQITLNSGTVYANYASGSGTANLTFTYTVAMGNLDNDGITLVSPIDLNGATLQDGVGNNASLAISTSGTGSILVDGTNASVSSLTLPTNGSYKIGDNLNFIANYTKAVNVAGGTPRIQITLNSGTVYANFTGGSGSSNLTFTYTVATNDLDNNGITLVSPIDLNGATIKDAATNDADLVIPTTGTGSILVDGVAPSVSSLTLPANQTYAIGDNLDFIANYNEAVTIAGGTPRIQITLNSGTVYANYLSGSGTSNLTFRYTVATNDLDADGIALTSPIDLNGATMQDGAGNNADLAILTTGTGGILIDGVAPSVSSLSLPANQTYAIGDNLDFIANFNDAVTVAGGTPRIQINLNSGTVYANYLSGSGTSNLTFRYTVATNDLDNNGITLVSPIDANGATLQDINGNNANLIITTAGTGSLLVDGAPPVVTSITRSAPVAATTNATSVTFRVTFNEAVSNVDLTDFSLSGTAVGTLASVTPVSTTIYDVTVNTISGDGALNLDFGVNNIVDANGNSFAGTINSEQEYTIDNTPPTVSSIVRTDANPHDAGINAGNVNFTVTFSEPVNNVDISDFTFSSSNLIGTPTVASVNASSGTVFTVNINNFDLDYTKSIGNLNLNLVATGTITDNVGNDNVSDVVAGADETYSIINPEPADPITLLASPSQTSNSIDLTWNLSTNEQRAYQLLLLVKESGSFPNPTDGTFISTDNDLNSGTIGQMHINLGRISSYTVTGLNSGTTYDFELYPYTNNGSNVNFKTTAVATLTQATPVASFTQVNYSSASASISSLTNTQAEALGNTPSFVFNINDDGATNGADNAKTKFTQLRFTQGPGNGIADWTQVIAGARLEAEGSDLNTDDDPGSVSITASAITFSSLSTSNDQLGEVDDNENKQYTLRIWLKTNLPDGIDNSDIVFELDASNTSNLTLVTGSSGIDPLFNKSTAPDGTNAIDIQATQLTWNVQPQANIGVLAPFSVAPQVYATDANGNRDTDFNAAITTLSNTGAIATNNNPASAPAKTFTTGSYTFDISTLSGFTYQDAGNGTLTMIAGGLTTPASNGVTVSYSDNTTIVKSLIFNESVTLDPTVVPFLQVGQITITDDNTGVSVNDKAPTLIDQVIITAVAGPNAITTNWSDAIDQAALVVDGGSPFVIVPNANITSNSITLALPTGVGDVGYIADDATKELEIWIKFKPTMTGTISNTIDNKNFIFEVTTASISTGTGSSTIAPIQSYITDNTKNFVDVQATELRFETQPTTTFINENMNPVVEVEATDANGNRDVDDNTTLVAITSDGSLNPATVSNTLSNGVASFNIVHTAIATSRQLTAKDNAALLTAATSNLFDIDPGSAESEIVTNAITYPTNIDYAANTGNNVTAANPKMFEFSIKDGDGTNDADGLPTNVTSLSFDIAGFEQLQFVGLYDASNIEIAQVAAASTITFNFGTPLAITDDGNSLYHLRATFKSSVTDNTQIKFTVSGAVANANGSTFRNTDGSTASNVVAQSSVAGDDNRIEVTHSQLVFSNIPTGSIFTGFSPAIQVQALDSKSNLDLDFAEAITAYSNTSTTPGGSLSTLNNPTGNFSAGVFTFPNNFQFTTDGTGITISISTATYDGTPSASPVSNSFDIITSNESNLTLASGFVPSTTIEYINYTSSDITGSANAFELARLSINDGGTSAPPFTDVDGASTVLDEIEFTLTNFNNIKRIALYETDGTTEIAELPGGTSTVTFTSLAASLIAPDNSSKEFSVYVTFDETNVTDKNNLQLTVSSITPGGGSGFADPIAGGGAQTSPTANNLNVTATQYAFSQQPAAIEGVNKNWTNAPAYPTVQAVDANNLIDVDINEAASTTTFSITAPAGVTCPACLVSFVNGVLNLNSIRYTGTGNGTITIKDVNLGRPTPINTGISSTVDVVNTELSLVDISNYVPIGTTVLASGEGNQTLLGFQLDVANSATINPVFDNLSVTFTKDTTDIFKNLRLYKVINNVANPLINVDYQLVSGSKTDNSLSASQLIFDGFSEVLNPATPTQYVLVADVDPAANAGSGNIIANIQPSEGYLVAPAGSMTLSGAPVASASFTFNDARAPLIIATNPANGDLSTDFNTTVFTLTFDEFVTPNNPVFELRNFDTDALVSDMFTLNNNTSKTFNLTFVDGLNAPIALAQGVKYYITLQEGGFIDNSGNLNNTNNVNAVLTTKGFWAFTTSDTQPPSFVFNVDKSELQANVYDNGFDIKVKLSEPGTVYVLAQPSPGADPDYATLTSDASVVSSVITLDSTFYYLQVRGLSNNTTYDVYVAAEDNGGNPTDASDYTNLAFDRAQKISITTASFTDLVSEPTVEICTGEFQPVPAPIVVIESANNDFATGSNAFNLTLPAGYEFNTTVGSVMAVPGGDVTTPPTLSYLNPSTITVDFTADNTLGRDEIRVSGLEIKASVQATDGNMVISGNIAAIPFAAPACVLDVTSLPAAQFDLLPNDLTINSITTNKVALIQTNPVDPFIGETYAFTGNGVTNDTLFVDFAPLGNNVITLTQTFEGGCQSVGTKTVNIIDNQFSGLDFTYCGNGGTVVITQNITDPNDPFNGYDLEELTVNTNLLTNPGQTSAFNPATFELDLAAVFDPADPYKYDFVSLNFEGKYRKRIDFNDSILVTQKVDIYVVPGITIRSETIPDDDNDGVIGSCEDRGTILLSALVQDNPGNVNSIATGTGVFTLQYGGNDVSSFITNTGVGTASVNSDQLAAGPGLGVYTITYQYTNPTSKCVVSDQFTLEVFPKPVADFSIAGKSNLAGCVNEPLTFTNQSDVLTGASFAWKFNDDNFNADNPNSSTVQDPTHFYSEARGSYIVSLQTTSDKGCVSDLASKSIEIGAIPATSFAFRQIATGSPTLFTNTTPLATSNVTVDSLAWIIDGVFTAGINSNFNNDYSYTFAANGQHQVVLTAISDKNCALSDTLNLFTVPLVTLNDATNYFEDFDDAANAPDPGNWVAYGTNSSWGVGNSGGDSIQTIPSTNSGNVAPNFNFWVTGVNSLYNSNEQSYVYSPIFDISGLERPMIQFLKFAHLSSGVVVEYLAEETSGTSSNGIDNSNWKLLGTLNSGENWYNEGGIEILGGNTQITGQYGWTGSDRETFKDDIYLQWKKAKHTLDAAKADAGASGKVQFRFSFRSSAEANVGNFNGFAFDNVFIGNRTRTVLLENFSNAQLDDGGTTKTQNDAIRDLQAVTPTLATIQYQLNNKTGSSNARVSNSTDGDARALYYGINETPRVAVDGAANASLLFSQWAPTALNIRSLNIAPLDIQTSDTQNGNTIEIASVLKAKQNIDGGFIVHMAIVENQVVLAQASNSGETLFDYVVQKMLPNAAGTKINEPLLTGNQITVTNTWQPTKAYASGEISIIVFVQDEMSREIYQAEIFTPTVNIVTGLQEELNESGIAVWPNPANTLLKVTLAQPVATNAKVFVYNQLGALVHTAQVKNGQNNLEINTTHWTPGMYYIQAYVNETLTKKRILIQH